MLWAYYNQTRRSSLRLMNFNYDDFCSDDVSNDATNNKVNTNGQQILSVFYVYRQVIVKYPYLTIVLYRLLNWVAFVHLYLP